MKKHSVILAVLGILLLSPSVSLAALPARDQIGINDIVNIVSRVLSAVWILFVSFAVVMFIVAGGSFLTAQGEPEKTAQARRFVLWGVIGIVVAILGFSVVLLIRNQLGL